VPTYAAKEGHEGQPDNRVVRGEDDYAFMVTKAEFDEIRERIVARGLTYYADPFHRRAGEINTDDGGRGLYWDDPNGHNLEIITVPYGG
jgi:hypothetical protein